MVEPSHNFLLTPEQLRHAASGKWTIYPADVLPLWVADMDFAIAPSIRSALQARLDQSIGYAPFVSEPLMSLLRAKLERLGIVGLPENGSLHLLPGVVAGLYLAVLGLTERGDDVLTMTPIYPPFLSAIQDQGRTQRLAPLIQTTDGWRIDWAAMEAAVTPKTKLLMLCHPHNPCGRVWTREELAQIANFAARHDLFVCSDELHADLTLEGGFAPFVTAASPALRDKTVTLTGPCKTYNTAGLGIGVLISHNADLVTRLKKSASYLVAHPNGMSIAMWTAALQDDGQWLASVLSYLRGNRDWLTSAVAARLPLVNYAPPQATYLAWLDYRAHPRAGDIHQALLNEAKVALNDGTIFGPGYEGFVRLNFATSRAILEQALDRMCELKPVAS